MKRILQGIMAVVLLGSLTVQADTFILSWTPPAENEDGTPLLEQELDFYTVYVDSMPVVNLDVIIGTWTAQIIITKPGTWPVYMTVTNLHGKESRPSNQLLFTVGSPIPGPVVIRTITKM